MLHGIRSAHKGHPVRGRVGLLGIVAILCLPCAAYPADEADSVPILDRRRPLSALPPGAPQTPPATEAEEASPQSPNQRALARLAETSESDDASPSWQPPTRTGIARFGERYEMEESDADQRIERAQLQTTLQEADALTRTQQGEAAVALLQAELETVQQPQNLFLVHQRLGTLYFRLQDYVAAAIHMEAALNLQPDNAAMASNLAAAQMTVGDLDAALATLQSIRLGMVHNPQLLFSIHFNLACLYSMKGDTEVALENLFKAAEADAPSVLASLGDPQIDALRSDIRFQELQMALESMVAAPTAR